MNWLNCLPDVRILALSIVVVSTATALLPLIEERLPNFAANEQTTDNMLRLPERL